MEYLVSPRDKGKRGLISKTWERCKYFSGGIARKGGHSNGALKMKSKSWPRNLISDFPNQGKFNEKRSHDRVAPDGCLSIYVGSERQRFVIRTEYVNHPLFRTLLEEAESQYGFSSEGPLVLPCEVEHFIQVLVEMDSEGIEKSHRCNFFTRSHSTPYHTLTPPSLVIPINNNT